MLFCLISCVGGDPKRLICPGSNARDRDANADVPNQILVNNTRRARLLTKSNIYIYTYIYCCFTSRPAVRLARVRGSVAVLFQKDVGGDVRKGDYRAQGKPLASCILRNKRFSTERITRNNIKVPSSSVHVHIYVYMIVKKKKIKCKKKPNR